MVFSAPCGHCLLTWKACFPACATRRLRAHSIQEKPSHLVRWFPEMHSNCVPLWLSGCSPLGLYLSLPATSHPGKEGGPGTETGSQKVSGGDLWAVASQKLQNIIPWVSQNKKERKGWLWWYMPIGYAKEAEAGGSQNWGPVVHNHLQSQSVFLTYLGTRHALTYIIHTYRQNIHTHKIKWGIIF